MRQLHPHAVTIALAISAPLCAPVVPVFAQSSGDQSGGNFPDLVPVVIWTVVAAATALLVTSVAYLYRREHGLDRPLVTPPIEDGPVHEGEGSQKDAAGHPLPGHVLAEHAPGRHDDALEQAKLLHQH